jgi:hypothetical protein
MSTGNRPPAPTSRPAPPASGRPAPPKTGRPAPPPSNKSESSPSNLNCDRAIKLEAERKYQEASLYYQECGDLNSATRCLKLALVNQTNTTVNNVHYGDKNIQDSVITGQE